MNIKKYQIVNVQAYKHNGFLYRQWNGVLVFDITKDFILLAMPQTKVIESKGQSWRVSEPMLWYFPLSKQFYNSTVLIRKAGYYIYTNLASPFIFEDNTIKFIDYDLDLKLYPKSKINLVDVEEYKKNLKIYNYPLEIQDKIIKTKDFLIKEMTEGKFIFSKDLTKKYFAKLITENQYTRKLK